MITETERVTETERERPSQKDVCDRQSEIGIERVIYTDTETEVGKVKDSFLGKKLRKNHERRIINGPGEGKGISAHARAHFGKGCFPVFMFYR